MILKFFSEKEYIACSRSGVIVLSTDSGETWKEVFRNQDVKLHDLFFVNRNFGWAISNNRIFRTKNGGFTWEEISFEIDWLHNIHFVTEMTGFLRTSFVPLKLLKTTDAGDTWKEINDSVLIKYGRGKLLTSADTSTIFIAGSADVLKSVDQGETWEIDSLPPEPYGVYDFIKFTDSTTGFIASRNMMILKTTDKGKNWFTTLKATEDFHNNSFMGADFTNNTGFIQIRNSNDIEQALKANNFTFNGVISEAGTNYSNRLVRSTDAGNTWEIDSNWFFKEFNKPSLSSALNDSVFLITGKYAVIALTKDKGESFTHVNKNNAGPITGIRFFNDFVGYVSTTTDIMKTTDGGWTFEKMASIPVYPDLIYSKMYFTDSVTCFLLTTNSLILKSTDLGKSWKRIPIDVPEDRIILKVDFPSIDAGYATSNTGFFKTTNNGESWNKIINGPVFHFSCIGSQEIWITNIGRIYYSSDAGNTWNYQGDQQSGYISFADKYCGIVEKAYTTNGGYTWNHGNLLEVCEAGDILFELILFKSTENIIVGYAGFESGALYYTVDTGRTWQKDEYVTTGYNSYFFFAHNTLWASSFSKEFLIKRKNFDKLTGIDDKSKNDFSIKHFLSHNYPNPFNPSTTIKYSIPERGFVTIKVFDLLGREIRTLLNEEKQTGSYEIIFNADGLPSGIYFYSIQVGNFSETRKMLLVK